MRRFWILSILWWVVGGLLATYGVAIGIALLVDLSSLKMQDRYGPVPTSDGRLVARDDTGRVLQWTVMRDSYGPHATVLWSVALAGGPDEAMSMQRPMPGWMTPPWRSPPEWFPFERPTFEDLGEHTSLRMAALSTGWPTHGTWCVYRNLSDAAGPEDFASPDIRGGFVLPAEPWGQYVPKVLPIRPRWPGFVVNWSFYSVLAVLAWLPAWATVSWRRARRVGRGACIDCGHPLAGQPVCPECGRLTPARTAGT